MLFQNMCFEEIVERETSFQTVYSCEMSLIFFKEVATFMIFYKYIDEMR